MRPAQFALTVNGRACTVEAEGDAPLLDILRDTLGLTGSRFGCGLEQCGACNVLLDGRAVPSCTLPLSAVAGRTIVTIEGLGTPANPHRVQQAFLDEQAAQCGYCTSGMIVSAAALLQRTPAPTAAEIKAALEGNLCRCGAHNRIVRAVLRAAQATK
ncbi:MAG: (2Fe-2S)-binding protein [Betaproteobacteria bacterium]